MPDMQQQKDWAVELRKQCLPPSRPCVSVLQVAERTEPAAALLGTELEPQLAQTVTAASLTLAVVPTVPAWVAPPHCCTLVRTADGRVPVAGKEQNGKR